MTGQRPGPRPVDASREGWTRLAEWVKHVRIGPSFKCETLPEFAEKIGMSLRTLQRVESADGVSMRTLVQLDVKLNWQPGTAVRILKDDAFRLLISSIDGKPVLEDEEERALWETLEGIESITAHDRQMLLATFRDRRDMNERRQQIG